MDVETKAEFSIDESTANQAQDNSLPLLANSSSVANEVEGVNETQQSVLEDNALHMEKVTNRLLILSCFLWYNYCSQFSNLD